MSYAKFKKSSRISLFFIALFAATHCSNMLPDGSDLRDKNPSSVLQVGAVAPNFSLTASDNTTLTLSSALLGKSAVVLYFTMWCSVCSSHTDEIVQTVMPAFPNVRFVFVDYVSANTGDAATLKTYAGYDGTGASVALNTPGLMESYGATMASLVVIDNTQKIRLNETYKKSRLVSVLGAL